VRLEVGGRNKKVEAKVEGEKGEGGKSEV